MRLLFCLHAILCDKNVNVISCKVRVLMFDKSVFDFRSDTVTRPDEAMRAAMAAADSWWCYSLPLAR